MIFHIGFHTVDNVACPGVIFTFRSRDCGQPRGNVGHTLWGTVDNPRSGRRGTTDDLHLLSAVPWDLELPEPGDLELRAALPAHEVDVEIVHVLRLRGSRLVRIGRRRGGQGEGADHRDPHTPDHEASEQSEEDDDPRGHLPTIATQS